MLFHKLRLSYIKKLQKKQQLFTVLTILLVVLSIPLTVVVLQEEQDNRQIAAKKSKKIIRIGAVRTPKEKYVPEKISVRLKKRAKVSVQATSLVEDRIRERFKAILTRHDDLDLSEVKVARGEEDATLAELRKDPDVERANRVVAVYAIGEPDDSDFGQQWGMTKIAAPAAWDVTEGSEDVMIAVIDSGIDENHPDLKGKIASGSKVFHANSNTTDDLNGHGTHVAGTIGAVTNNGKGIAGVCPKCKILNVKTLEHNSSTGKAEGDGVNTAKGIKYAVNQGADILSMSFAFTEDDPNIREAIEYASQKGVMLIAAAGNDGSTNKIWPAAYDDMVLAVGATSENDEKASFSNYGPWVDVAAPGDKIYSTFKDGQYSEMSGTSMAAPYVSGIAGLLASQGMDASQIREKIESSTDETPGTGDSWVNGRVNAARALDGEVPDSKPTKSPRNPDKNTDPDTDEQPEPCVTTPPNTDRPPRTGNPPNTPSRTPGNNRTPNTPDRNNAKKDTGKNRPGDNVRDRANDLRTRLLDRANEIRSKFLGGGRAKVQSRSADDEEEATPTPKRERRNERTEDDESTPEPTEKVKRERKNTPDTNTPCDPGQTPRDDRSNERVVVTQNPERVVVTIRHEEIVEPRITIGSQQSVRNQSNAISIIDYNGIIDCYSDVVPPRNCDEKKKSRADINGDGLVNSLDYNQFLKRFAATNR